MKLMLKAHETNRLKLKCGKLLSSFAFNFNLHHCTKVIQGTMQATRQYYDNKESMLQLWCHECFRIFGDRMWDLGDKEWLQTQLDAKLHNVLGTPAHMYVSCHFTQVNTHFEPSFLDLNGLL